MSLVRVCLTLPLLLSAFLTMPLFAGPVDYDIIYLRAPRYGDAQNTTWPEIFHPASMEPGTDLMLLHPDGSEEVLLDAGNGAVADPVLSFDAKTVYYSFFPDMTDLNSQRSDLPRQGADLYKMDLATRQITRLTFGEWTPNQAAGDWAPDPVGRQAASGQNYLGYGILNTGPCPLPGGKIVFTSNRNGFMPNKSFTQVCFQLYVMDDDGTNVEQIGFLNIGSALHPTILTDGRVMFSSYEAQGLRDRRVWGLWSIWPDGRNWGPLMSAFKAPSSFHFQTQLNDGRIAVIDYYNLNNNGFGTLLAFDTELQDGPAFGSPYASDPSNPEILSGVYSNGNPLYTRYPFSPQGLTNLTTFTHGRDEAAPLSDPDDSNSVRVGKVTHPAASRDGVLMVWTPGPANDLNRPTTMPYYDGGLYLLPGNQVADSPDDLLLIKNDPNYNEQWPKAVLPYSEIYGVDQPTRLSWLPNDGSEFEELPEGTPYGIVGTAGFYNRNTTPGSGKEAFDGLDPFNTSENGASSNWKSQGSDAGLYENSDIWAVRILAMEPLSHRSYGRNGGCCGGQRNFTSHAGERLRILGELPLRKTDGQGNALLDGDGNPDTSFLARIPADVPFTFQTLDRNRMALNTSQTWHQVRPGEARYDCGGCHAHAETPTNFQQTAAALPTYTIADFVHQTPILSKDQEGQPTLVTLNERAVDVEYYRDIKPILERSCVPCHNQNNPTAQLVLDDEEIVDRHENTYNRLARDESATYGYPPVITNGTWRETNASRYIRKFQSRRSLLVWKVFGGRLDGWSNEDHPTEIVPGDAGTLPAGASANNADLDFTGTIMPPPDARDPVTDALIQPLTEDEKMLIATWIDLGCPANETEATGDERTMMGWFLDDLRPTLTVTWPRPGLSTRALTEFRLGAFDYYSGLVEGSLSVTADFAVNGLAPGSELAGLFQETGDHIWTLALDEPIEEAVNRELVVSVRDEQGNVTTVKRRFSVQAEPLRLFPLGGWRNASAFDQNFDLNGNGSNDVQDMVLFLRDL